jgi:hypothetical protein
MMDVARGLFRWTIARMGEHSDRWAFVLLIALVINHGVLADHGNAAFQSILDQGFMVGPAGLDWPLTLVVIGSALTFCLFSALLWVFDILPLEAICGMGGHGG